MAPTPDEGVAATTLAVAEALRAGGCVFAEDEAAILVAAAQGRDELAALTRRRAAGEPLEHLVGWADFGGHRIAVGPGVFVPRRRTQLLAREAVAAARRPSPGAHPGAATGTGRAVVVDLCCGSGAVGAYVAAALPGVDLYAVDLDAAAVAVARRNLSGTGAVVLQGDLLGTLPRRLRGRVDVVAVNPPYVPAARVRLLPPEARLHEPRLALDGGPDGLHVVRRIAAEAPAWLAAGGRLLVETSEEQAATVVDLLARRGLAPSVVTDEDLGATVVVASA
jgi:release factor glutamine methyltransferase